MAGAWDERVQDAERRERRSKGKRRRTHSSKERGDTGPAVEAPPTYEPPADLDALRAARLKSLQSPASERRKMVFEYAYERSNKAPSSVEKNDLKRNERASKAAVSRRASTRRVQATGHGRRGEGDIEQQAQYVYGPPRPTRRASVIEQTANASRTTPAVDQDRVRTRRPSVSGKPLERRQVERINSEPLTRKKTVSSTMGSTRPPLRKSTTSIPSRAQTEINATMPEPQPRKQASVFGSLFTKPTPPPSIRRVSCLTCGDDEVSVIKTAKLPCGHRMCHSCLRRIFELSITDPAHMPPKCCTSKHIDLKHVDSLFDQDFKKTWNRKFKEYNAKNRIYCPRRGCGEWIQPKHMVVEQGRRMGRCPQCKTYVCGTCSQKAHKSKDCPNDPTTKQLVEVAKEKGWQRCFNCKAIVELKEGCNHMTCRCTAEFCMVCGLKWKSCDCPWFNYENVDAHLGNPARYQEEIDRRREQEHRDEALARRLAGLAFDRPPRPVHAHDPPGAGVEVDVGVGNAAGHHMNQNFIRQAREALAADREDAEQVAQGLLRGLFAGREHALPPVPDGLDDTVHMLRAHRRRRNVPAQDRTAQNPPPDDPAGEVEAEQRYAYRRYLIRNGVNETA